MLLDTPIDVLPATSPLTIKKLKNLEVNTFFDLINCFPYRYEDYSLVSPISRIQEGEVVTVKGIITSSKNEYTRRGFKLQKVSLQDASGSLQITWYNQPYLIHILKQGLPLAVAGEVIRYAGRLTLAPKEWELLKTDNIHTGRIVPVYSEAGGVSSKTMREKLFHIFTHLKHVQEPDEFIPPGILAESRLAGLHDAYLDIHFPANKDALHQARRRLGFDEFLFLQLSTLLTRYEWEKRKVAYSFSFNRKEELQLEKFMAGLPFELTADQKKTVSEIRGDLEKDIAMNRFLQGDVGSGKTVVAAVAAYIAYLSGYKTLIMAPTEILAMQHYETISKLFNHTPVQIGLYTGSKKDMPAERKNFDIVIGTHALLAHSAKYEKVGLVVIDEQHRFGVAQRAMLKQKGGQPHLLTMTATPIPRTLALTLYGELDLSFIQQMPEGRIPIRSFLVPPQKREAAYEWVRKKIKEEKTQVFIICPLIEESDIETLQTAKAAKKEYEHLKEHVFPDLHVSLLHGKLKSAEKEKIMKEFASGQTDILVSTSVVEVGIDIPNATVMIIEGAEKFGLAQLHQLRGRVGRGKAQSYCYLFSESQDGDVLRRLEYFASHGNGAELAEYDLRNRGPGNIFGTSQHGYMKLKVASLSDLELIKKARDTAISLLKTSADLSAYPALKEIVASYRSLQITRD